MTPLEQTLQTALETMTKTNEMLERQYQKGKARNAELSAKINELLAQIAWLQRKLFGRSSEKFNPDNHPSLFSEEELGAEPKLEEACEEQAEPANPGTSEKPKRQPVSRARQGWENLPVLETVTLEPEGVDTERYRRMGEEVTYTVEIQAGKLYRKEIIRPKYGLKDPMEPVEKGKGVLIAPMPLLPIPYRWCTAWCTYTGG